MIVVWIFLGLALYLGAAVGLGKCFKSARRDGEPR